MKRHGERCWSGSRPVDWCWAGSSYDPDLLTEVELTFSPEGLGTRVTLEHRNLEGFGADAEKLAGQLGGGWPGFLSEYATYVDKNDN